MAGSASGFMETNHCSLNHGSTMVPHRLHLPMA
jgi:hypothetical protein